MNLKRSDLLAMLFYGFDIATRPTLSNLTQSHEGWLRYNRLHPSQLSKLKSSGMVEKPGAGGDASWALRLTEKGRLRVLGGRDPEGRWGRGWDGEWRLLMFDIPKGNDKARRRFYRWLRQSRFGCLQKSVWLSPDPLADIDDVLGSDETPAGNIAAIEGRPCFGGAKSDAEFVRLAWEFEDINRRYTAYIDFAKSGVSSRTRPAAASEWVVEERNLWARAVDRDPLLPDELLPAGYLGKKAWDARRKLLKKAAPMVVALDLALL